MTDQPNPEQDRMCPNSNFSVGNYVVGTFTETGTQRFESLIEIDEELFSKYADKSVEWEENMRQFGTCHQSACKNWGDHKCQVPQILKDIGLAGESEIPKCEIRPYCRWYHQEGPDICKKCDLLPKNEYLGVPQATV
jgi:hypothetical protein